MHGQGEGSYRLARAGAEVWAKKLPFTLWQAAVTDDGTVVGYAYTHGLHGFPPTEKRDETSRKEWEGYVHAVIIDSKGELRLNEREKRARSGFLDHDVAYPAARGLFVDPANDRFVIRFADPDLNRQIEKWVVYRLSDGKRLTSFEPAEQMKGADRRWDICDAQPVSGTPWTLVHWYILTLSDQADDAKFTLVDEHGKPVWTLDRPGDYAYGGDSRAAWAFQSYLRDHSVILDVSKPRQFELWFPAGKSRVRFEVRPAPAGDPQLSVVEIGRRDYAGMDLPKREEPTFASVELKSLGSISLRAPTAAPHAIRHFGDFDFDDQGRIGFVRRDEQGPCVFVLAGPTGEIVCELPLKGTEEGGPAPLMAAWLAGDRWVAVKPCYGVGAKSRAWVLRVESASLTAIDHFDCPQAEAVAGTHDGGFVVLATHHYEYTMSDELIAFDAAGKRQWSVQQDYSKDGALFSPEDVAVMDNGVVAVVDNIRKRVQLYDKGGAYCRMIDLKEAFGQEPNYPTDIAADRDGGLIVHDFNGSPPVWRLRSDGAVMAKFNPKFGEGREFSLRAGAKAAPDGRLWATDGESLCRLTDAGVVDLILGQRPDSEELSETVAFTTDSHGLFYAVSSRTGAVHVFERDGELRHVCKPLPTDFASNMMDAKITVARDGSVYVTGTGPLKGYLQFAADGQRIGVSTLADGRIGGEWHFKPDSRERWITGWQEVYRVGGDGKQIQTIKRRPDRNWLETVHGIGIAPDGSAAIGSYDSESMGFNEPVISLFGPEGEPIHTIVLPFDGYIHKIAYNGRCIVLSRGADLLVMDPRGASIRRFVPKSEREKPYWWPYFSPDADELWLYESGSRVVQRYQASSL